jgi:3-hydroxyisobutyrate dehydrogenase-like beta-hydroxyacid dehydrogenase
MDRKQGGIEMKEPVGFIGLGRLGLPVATNLVEAGHALRVYNRTASKADSLVARGAQLAARPVDVITPGGIVVTLVWDDAALESIATSEGLLERLGPGGVHIAMSTVLPETGRRLAALHAQHGSAYVEAPIFGRPEAAVARKLVVPIAGPDAAKARVTPVLEAMGAHGIFDFGEAIGAATTVKIVGNFLIISAARSMAEGIALAEHSGVDPKAVVDMLTTTLFAAPIYQSYGKMLVAKAPVMQSAIPHKDLGLFKQIAGQVGSPAPIAHHLLELVQTATRPA